MHDGLTPLLTLLDMPINVLQYHNRIVHHATHGHGDSTDRHDIERDALPTQDEDCREDGERDAHRRHKCGADGPQEDEDDQDGE